MAVKNLSDRNVDGTAFGQDAADKIAFYGATPAARQANTVDAIAQLVALGLLPSGSAVSSSSAAPVNLTGNTTLTPAAHAGRAINLNAAAGLALTPPAATGTGNSYTFYVGTTVTSNAITFTAQGSDKIAGVAKQVGAAGAMTGFLAAGAGTTVTLNGSTRGGIKGDIIRVRDVATNLWSVEIAGSITGTAATPFS